MAETYTLDAQPRTLVGKKVGQLRRQGIVPAAVFGKSVEPFNIQIPYRPLQVALMRAGGTHVINLNVEGRTQQVLAREVQRDVLRGDITYVDFLAVDARTKITASVPVHFVGESPAVKTGSGVLLNGIQTVQIEALPADLIDRVDVDLSSLVELNDSIHIRDLNLGDKVTILNSEDDMLVRVTVQEVVEEEPLEAAAPVGVEPEVIEKGKKEDEDEG